MSKSIGRVEDAARTLGLEIEVRRFPEGTKTAEAAAKAIGCDVAQIVKSLVFMAGDEAVIALTSGANRADVDKLMELTGARVRRAEPEQARAATGFGIGGTPPFGHPQQLRVFLDRDLLRHEEIWAAAGTPDAVFGITPEELRRASHATVADIRSES